MGISPLPPVLSSVSCIEVDVIAIVFPTPVLLIFVLNINCLIAIEHIENLQE